MAGHTVGDMVGAAFGDDIFLSIDDTVGHTVGIISRSKSSDAFGDDMELIAGWVMPST